MRFEEKDWKTIEHTILVSTGGSGTGRKLMMNLMKILFFKVLESQPPLPLAVTANVPPVDVPPVDVVTELPVTFDENVVAVEPVPVPDPVPAPAPADDSDPFATVDPPASSTTKKSKK